VPVGAVSDFHPHALADRRRTSLEVAHEANARCAIGFDEHDDDGGATHGVGDDGRASLLPQS